MGDNAAQAASIIRQATDELVLIDKFVGDEVTAELAVLLRKDVTVQRITLRGNCIGKLGAMSLAAMLEENTTIISLGLEWNQVGSEGATAIAASLAKNRTLTNLDLRNNSITDEGAQALAEALRMNKRVKSLDLRWNTIGDKGALSFEEVLSRSEPSVVVQMGGNLMSTMASGRLEGIEMRRDELREMKHYDPMGEADAVAAKAKTELLNRDVADLQQHLELAKSQREELQRQLNASALQVTEIEQQVLREQFKVRQANDDLLAAKNRLAQMADEQRVLTSSWEAERQEITEEVKRIVREKEVELRSLEVERDGLRDRCRNADEEVKRVTNAMDEATKSSEQSKADIIIELNHHRARGTDLSAANAALEHENIYLKDLAARAADQRSALEQEFTLFRSDATAKLKEEVMRAESEAARIRLEHKEELGTLTELTTRQGKEIASLSGELQDAQAKNASFQVEASLEKDKAVTSARETEQLRSSSTISDLQQKLESFMQFRSELEERCQGYMKELAKVRETSAREVARNLSHSCSSVLN